VCRLQVRNKIIKKYNARLHFSADKQSSLEAIHVAHGIPIYKSAELLHHSHDEAYLLYHTNFVSAYCVELKQPMWSAAKISPNKVRPYFSYSLTHFVNVLFNAAQNKLYPSCHYKQADSSFPRDITFDER